MSILLVTFFYLDYAFPVYRKLVGIESYWSGHYPHEVLLHLLVLKGSNIVVVRPLPSWSCYYVFISTDCDKKVLSLSLFGLTNQVKASVLFFASDPTQRKAHLFAIPIVITTLFDMQFLLLT